jgi:hypothetical protein
MVTAGLLGAWILWALAAPAVAAENSVAWRRQFGAAAHDHAAGAAADAFGNVYCAGYEDPAGAPSRIAVWKFTSRGGFVWKRLIGPGRATECAVDRWGRLYVVGRAGSNVFAKKLSPSGAVLFDRRLSGADVGAGGEPAVAVRRSDGRAYVVGGRKCQAWALSPGGSVLTSVATTGTSADDVALSPGGRVYVVGTSDWTSMLPTASYLRRLDATSLATVWTREYEDGDMRFLRAVAADRDSVYVAGYRHTGYNMYSQWAFLAKHDASGTALWEKGVPDDHIMDGDELAGDFDVTVDVTGVYFAMTRVTWWGVTGATDVYVRKYARDSGTVWWRVIESQRGPPPARADSDYLGGLALDPVGNLYISGSTLGSFPPYVNRGGRDAILYKMSR